MKPTHTEGPWRWELNMQSKCLHLVGGRPRYDLTIMDFTRWGMGNATVRLRDTAHDGMNIMHKLHARPDWFGPQPGREHHQGWHQLVLHPDMRLIEAAPDLLSALRDLVQLEAEGRTEYESAIEHWDAARAAIAKAEGRA